MEVVEMYIDFTTGAAGGQYYAPTTAVLVVLVVVVVVVVVVVTRGSNISISTRSSARSTHYRPLVAVRN